MRRYKTASLNNKEIQYTLVPANHKVSIAWQIVLIFIPFGGLWAFYRIRKLRKLLLYLVLPEVAAITVFTLLTYNSASRDPQNEGGIYYYLSWVLPSLDFTYPQIIMSLVEWGLLALTIYLVIIWSRKHNRQFDQSATQTQPSN